MLLIGIVYGCGLGALIAYVRVPPWIATLAGYLAFRGLGTSILSVSVTNSISFKDNPDFLAIFSGTLFKTPEGEMNWPCMIVGIAAAALVVLNAAFLTFVPLAANSVFALLASVMT